MITYYDDTRATAPSKIIACKLARRSSSRSNFLGLPDATRKRTGPSQTPDAWAGVIVHTINSKVIVMVSQSRWDNTRSCIFWIAEEMLKQDGLNREFLEKKRGFLIYVGLTYPMLVPYFKGIHLTLESWRDHRDEDGWKLNKNQIKNSIDSALRCEDVEDAREFELEEDDEDLWHSIGGEKVIDPKVIKDVPLLVKPVTRLRDDITALIHLTESKTPPKRYIRGSGKICVVRYGFVDASGNGFGSSIELDGVILFETGVYKDKASPGYRTGSHESSNYKEFENLVIFLEDLYARECLNGCEVFIFTDSTTAEAGFYRGTSSSPKLFSLVLRLRRIELTGLTKLHVIHVAGTRMIDQGTDGLSRGLLSEGVMVGKQMLDFVPLHLNALDHNSALLNWIRMWCGNTFINPLEPEDWFKKAHGYVRMEMGQRGISSPVYVEDGVYLWSLPAAAADVAIEQLTKARHKRIRATHIFIVPRRWTYLWRRKLYRSCDIRFNIKPGVSFWKKNEHEPLTIAIFFPFCRHKPWQLRRVPVLLELAGMV